MSKVFIIAEAGVNHNGSLDLAKEMIDKAALAGADAVKFQTFKTENLVTKSARKADYQIDNTQSEESQYDMLKKLELDLNAHHALMDRASEKGIQFLSTPFDLESANSLLELGLPIFKIPSGELTNLPLLRLIGSFNKEIILSTGMANLKEVSEALAALIKAGTAKENITILHCNTDYPTDMRDVNLKAMLTIENELGVNIGYSDHTLGIEVPISAVSLGAQIIEKHFTLDRNMDGPDHAASLTPEELKNMIQSIRNIEKALGDGIKKPTSSELKNKEIARKSIFYVRSLRKGQSIRAEDLTTKRPGDGLSPMNWDNCIGKILVKDVEQGDYVQIGDLE